MTRVVYKYPIPRDAMPGQRWPLHLPPDAQFLCCANQHEELMTWWEVDPNTSTLMQRSFAYFETGQEFVSEVKRTYLGMLVLSNSRWIGHLYEIDAPIGPALSKFNRP